MIQIIENFYEELLWKPSIKKNGSNSNSEVDFSKCRNICFAGMGGSAFPADLLNTILKNDVIKIYRNYFFPDSVTAEDFIILESFSGGTEETISSLDHAIGLGAEHMIISHGGKLIDRAKAEGHSYIEIPECSQPRLATGYLLRALDLVYTKIHGSGVGDKVWAQTAEFLKENLDKFKSIGKELALKISGCVPIVYSSPLFSSLAMVTKINFNENSKTQSFYNTIPEMNHNEMVGYTNLVMKPFVIYLEDSFSHEGIKLRMKKMQELLNDKIEFATIKLEGSSVLEQLLYGLQISQFCSYYLALEYGIDPEPVEMVEKFKKLLN